NTRVMRKLGVSRLELLETIERPALKRAAERALPVCRMEEVPGRARLSCRGRAPLLLGSIAPDPRAGRGAHHRQHGRGLPQRQPDCEPSTLKRAPPTYDRSRAHAQLASSLRGVDAGADDA